VVSSLSRTAKPTSSQLKNKGRTTYAPENPKTAVPPSETSQHRFHFCSGASTPHQVAALARNLQKAKNKTKTKLRKNPLPRSHATPPATYTRCPGVAYPLPNASDALGNAPATQPSYPLSNPANHVNPVKNLHPREPEKIPTLPEDQPLKPENEPEKNLKIHDFSTSILSAFNPPTTRENFLGRKNVGLVGLNRLNPLQVSPPHSSLALGLRDLCPLCVITKPRT
jgi:hypothetical protein